LGKLLINIQKGDDHIEAVKLREIQSKYINSGLPINEFIHSYRVAELSVKIGNKLKLKEEDLKRLYTAAIFHDVGKARIPKQILNKKGKLTPGERKIIENHPVYSGEYIENIEELKELKTTVRAHHERWDGKGYPDNLKEEGIPLLARIISIADVYDAITNPRVYRPYGFSKEESKEIMAKGSGQQFDPKILKEFLNMI